MTANKIKAAAIKIDCRNCHAKAGRQCNYSQFGEPDDVCEARIKDSAEANAIASRRRAADKAHAKLDRMDLRLNSDAAQALAELAEYHRMSRTKVIEALVLAGAKYLRRTGQHSFSLY